MRCKYTVLVVLMFVCGSGISSAAQQYNYAEVLQKSMWFYEVQRSGALPDNNRVEWRGSSAVDDGADAGRDLSGGWYDAGDNMKFNFPMASSVTLLAWGGLEYGNGYRNIGQWGWLLSNIKWATDYLMKCHPEANVFYGQIGVGMTDHKWWGAPEVFPNERPAFRIDTEHPGSELAAEAAAALASSSMLFRKSDPAYADACVRHAKELYAFADEHRGLYHEAISDVTDFYKSWSGYTDELVWAALWMYLATEEKSYLEKAEKSYGELSKEPQSETPRFTEALSWDDKTYGCYVLLAKITDKERYHTDARRWLDWWSHGFTVRQSGNGGTWSRDEGVQYTPGGLAWVRQWGPLRYAANTAFSAFVYSDCVKVSDKTRKRYYDWAKSQIDYALGDNELKRSYVCGFGNNPPNKPHHRSMHGPYLDDNGRTPVESRHILYGALIGGPGQDGSFEDDRLDAVRNEVATDYNAGFSSALARLVGDFGGTALPDFPQPATRDAEYKMVAKINTAGERFTEVSATVMNMTTWPARYSENLTFRYYVDLSEVFEAGLSADDVNAEYRNCHLCEFDAVATPLRQSTVDDNIYYTEISFNENEKIFPGGQSAYRREVQFRIGLPDSITKAIWDPSNDPSFAGLTQSADTSGHAPIPVFENGVPVWGKDVDGSVFTPGKGAQKAFNEPHYAFSGWKASMFKGADPNSIRHALRRNYTKQRYHYSIGKRFIKISASENVRFSLYRLNGTRLHQTVIAAGTSCRIPVEKCSSGMAILSFMTDKRVHYHRETLP